MLFWNNKKKKELEIKEALLDEREKQLKIMFLNMVIQAKHERIKAITDLYFDAIK